MLIKIVQKVDMNPGVDSDVRPTIPDIDNDETQDSDNVGKSSSNLGPKFIVRAVFMQFNMVPPTLRNIVKLLVQTTAINCVDHQ
ncbi:hypothetical protein QVD17_33019 [Tagetes erecta]|uniref:Uncharacterized protein n=1 Tax=Tagetes erecta TaxID=13708 RepID=A0AAD8K0H9_TARER|nr:hypothetical protein QVD17_33019 [Tagetes erecta]